MSNTFGIKQSFRSQSIARKFARTQSSTQHEQESLPSSQNIFESGNNSFASDVLNRKNGGQVQISNLNLNNNSSTSLPSLPSLPDDSSNEKVDCRRIVSARLLHMKNYNKAVTRSADHM